MLATLVSVAAVVLFSVLVGQAICFVAGARRWTPAAPAVGLSVLMLASVPALHLPGRMVFAFALMSLGAAAGAVLLLRRSQHRPPAAVWIAGALVTLAACIPFYAQGRFGILGVGVNNDMAAHLLYAGAYQNAATEAVTPLLTYYPFGPHALVAALGEGFGLSLDGVFAGLIVAMPVLTALGVCALLLRRLCAAAAVAGSVAASLPYLVASYLGQGAFKELMLISLLAGVAGALVWLRESGSASPGRLLPLGLITAGVLSAYSIPGLAWIAGTVGLTAAAHLGMRWRRAGLPAVVADARGLLVPAAVAGIVTVVTLVPQAPRLKAFWSYMHGSGTGTGIEKTDLGNLVGPLKALEGTGMWLSADFRFAPAAPTISYVAGIILLAAAAWGAVRLLRRRELELVALAVTCVLLWWYSDRTQSPYTTAKALAIISTFVVLLAVVALLEGRRDHIALRLSRWGIALGLAVMAAVSSFLALRYMPVGPREHEQQLAAFRPEVRGHTVAFLGNDEFATWYLAGAAVVQPQFASGSPQAPAPSLLPVKSPTPGTVEGFDFDSMGTAALDQVDYVVVARDGSDSDPPSNFRLIRTEGPWELYRRTGPTPVRGLLSSEHGAAGAVLDCSSEEGRAVLRGKGVAAVRPAPIRVPLPTTPAGATARVTVPVADGTYDLGVAYGWREDVEVRAPGVAATLPASLDRIGAYYTVGRVNVAGGRVAVAVRPAAPRWNSPTVVFGGGGVALTRVAPERIVPVRRACGKYLDWYRPAGM